MKTHTCHTCHARLAPGALFALALAAAAALAPAPAANAAGFSNTPAAHTPASAASGGATATAGGVYLAAPGAVADPGTVVAESETGALPAATLVGGELVPATPAAAAGAGDGAVAAAVAGTSDDTLPQAAAGTPILRITPATRVVPGMISGSGFFVVSNAGGGTLKWAVEEPAPENTILWARDVSGSSGVNTGTLTFTYDANPAGGSYREGYLSISATHMETGGLHKNYAMLLQVANRSGGGAGALPDLIHFPSGLAAAPDGTLYASSLAGSTIHKITLAGGTGAADTLAGKTGASGHVNATGTAARFNQPAGIALAANALYVADTSSHVIRRLDLATLAVTTVAGAAGQSGFENGTSAAARLAAPEDIAANPAGTAIYLLQNGEDDLGRDWGVVRKLTLAGTGGATTATVSTFAGMPGVSGTSDGIGTAARFKLLSGIAVSADGTLYVGERHEDGPQTDTVLRKISADGTVTTLTGTLHGTWPHSLVVDDARKLLYLTTDTAIYATDISNASTGDGSAFVAIAGAEDEDAVGGHDFIDGPASAARFDQPFGLAMAPNGDLYIADAFNNAIRKLTTSGAVSTLLLTATATSGTGGGNNDNPGGNNNNKGTLKN